MKIISLDQHRLLKQWFRLMRQTETLPAHLDQTALITKLGAWGDDLKAHLDKHGLLKTVGKPHAEASARVLKVTYQGQTLILEEHEIESLPDYFEDWNYREVKLEFTTMPVSEVADLPEFDGF
jgi:hypothetical protein